jgi:hypothetical protein
VAVLCCATVCGATDPAQATFAGDASAGAGGRDSSVADGSNLGAAQTRGTVGGQSFASNGALAIVENPLSPGSPPPSLVTVGIPANFVATCAGLNQECFQGTAHPNEARLAITLASGTTPLAPGFYAIVPSLAGAGLVGSAEFSTTDAQCAPAGQVQAAAGSVTVSTVDGSSIAGDFQLDFSGGDHLQGEFTAPYCYLATSGICGTEVGPRPIHCEP